MASKSKNKSVDIVDSDTNRDTRFHYVVHNLGRDPETNVRLTEIRLRAVTSFEVLEGQSKEIEAVVQWPEEKLTPTQFNNLKKILDVLHDAAASTSGYTENVD